MMCCIIIRYNVNPEPPSDIDQESIDSDIIIPIRLRYIITNYYCLLHCVPIYIEYFML